MYHSLFSGAVICHWGRAGTQIECETLMLGEEVPLHQWSACSDPLRRESGESGSSLLSGPSGLGASV